LRFALVTLLAVSVVACSSSDGSAGRKTIVVTYSILGAVVRDIVGSSADVVVMIPNGSDPHEWEPSARDIERLNHADLIVRNGLDLEGGLQDALDRAASDGVPTFTATDHITVRTVGAGEGLPSGDPDQAVGAKDPHLWMDPLTMKQVVDALTTALTAIGIDTSASVPRVERELDDLNTQVTSILDVIPPDQRKLVTGHESLGYFAQRYGFTLVGALIPSLSTEASASAQQLAELADKIRSEHVKAVFTEIGTPKQIADTIATETGVSVVELASHNLPDDGQYATFMLDIAHKIAAALT
jgi:zinc/manganese transport system substrate-binding protein